jgi:hypothetical protein
MVVLSSDARAAETEMRAILFVLVAFAHIDGSVHAAETSFIHDTIDRIVDQRAAAWFGDDPAMRAFLAPRWRAHFYATVASIDNDIRSDFTESVAAGETAYGFVYARLKLRCFELLGRLEAPNRGAVLGMIDRLMHADGVVHPAEQRFRDELFALLEDEPTRVIASAPCSRSEVTVLDEPARLAPRRADHPFFSAFEQPYGVDPVAFAQQAAGDAEIVRRAEVELCAQRTRGEGRLDGALRFDELRGQEPFLDRYVYVHPPRRGVDYEVFVVGDLHGCYTCLKAAVLQADFLSKLEGYRADPASHPYPLLVFLGDYIDRGHHSYDGVLRTVLRLLLAAPEHVVVLRGNHEHYIHRNGRLSSPVMPAEGIESIAWRAPRELLVAHMRLFDALPSMLVFDRFLFVHAGIPREDTTADKLKSLGALNDPEIRLQMAWSDPSDADFVPIGLQRQSTRFPFGRMQFRSFMSRIGCSVMVRGHERVVEGIRRVYAGPDALLLSLFSAGGGANLDLPASSNYREVTPMALALRYRDGHARMSPFPLEYEHWNDPARNGLVRGRSVVST